MPICLVVAGITWAACEDLQVSVSRSALPANGCALSDPRLCAQQPGGAIALVSSAKQVEWFSKGYEVYGSAPSGSDDDYYLHMCAPNPDDSAMPPSQFNPKSPPELVLARRTKKAAVADEVDVLAVTLLGKNYSGTARARQSCHSARAGWCGLLSSSSNSKALNHPAWLRRITIRHYVGARGWGRPPDPTGWRPRGASQVSQFSQFSRVVNHCPVVIPSLAALDTTRVEIYRLSSPGGPNGLPHRFQ